MSPPFTDTVFYLPHAVENVEVPICFEGDRKLYHLLWTELLTTDEAFNYCVHPSPIQIQIINE